MAHNQNVDTRTMRADTAKRAILPREKCRLAYLFRSGRRQWPSLSGVTKKKPMRPKLVSWVSGLPDPETVTLALIALCPHIAHKRENQNVWRLR
jgi:hypothetical protein